MVKARRTTAGDDTLLDPAATEWQGIPPSEMKLDPTPVTAQPSKYIQEKWKDTHYGQTRSVAVRSAHNGERIYFHLSWQDETENVSISDTDQFTDAAAVLFPVNGDAPLQSMGSPKAPVNAWYWRPDLEQALSISAQGTGTTRRNHDPQLAAAGAYAHGAWNVVIRRTLASAATGFVTLSAGTTGKVGFAVWQGANQERGGLKAVTLDWQPLDIES